MKKFLIFILIIAVAIGGYYFLKNKNKSPQVSTTKQYRNSDLGISFAYPKILTASTTGETIILHHDIAFAHHDYCDFKGEGDTTIPRLTDFNVKIHTDNLDLISAMKKESPYIPQENFVNGAVVPSPGFIDSYTVGDLSGYKIFEGAEGCGQTIYYFPVSRERTLVITSDYITIFSGAIDPTQGAQALQVPGVISNEQNQQIFESILKSLKI